MITFDKTTTPKAWKGFKGGHWQEEINIRDFIQQNFTQYNGDESFLVGPTAATKKHKYAHKKKLIFNKKIKYILFYQ